MRQLFLLHNHHSLRVSESVDLPFAAAFVFPAAPSTKRHKQPQVPTH